MTGFLDLPAELRNRVYELIVANNQVVPISRIVKAPHTPYDLSDPIHQDHKAVRPRLPTLAAVNSQVRQEALSLYFGTNTFASHTITATHSFLKNLDRTSLSLIRDLRCTTSQISAVQQILVPKLQKLLDHYGRRSLNPHAIKVPLRTKRIGTGGRNQDFKVEWVSLVGLREWERDPRDIDMVRRKTLLSGY